MKTLGFNNIEICPWDSAVSVGCETVEYSKFSHSQTSLPMAIALGPKGPKMDVRITQILGFNKMEIRPWVALV